MIELVRQPRRGRIVGATKKGQAEIDRVGLAAAAPPNASSNVPKLFAGIPSGGIRALRDRGVPRVFPPGATLMRQGEFGDSMYIIESGKVLVRRDQLGLSEPVRLAELGPGEVVGEMGVLGRGTRSATVIAMEDTETIELSSETLADVMRDYPRLTSAILRALSERLNSTDDLLERARLAQLARRLDEPVHPSAA